MGAENEDPGLRTKVVLHCRSGKVEPGNGAVRPGGFAQPGERGIAWGELQHHRRAGICLTQEQHTPGRNHDDPGAFPGKKFEGRFESDLGSVANWKPPVAADQLLLFSKYSLPDAIPFTLLIVTIRTIANRIAWAVSLSMVN